MKPKIVAVGEVLWDLLPAGPQLGGAPANFAYHCRGLGADARLVTRVGSDVRGQMVFDRFHQLSLPTEHVQIDADRLTGTVEVELDPAGQPHYTISGNVAWDSILANPAALALVRDADAVCFGSLAQRAEVSRQAVRSLVAVAKPGAFRIFDVNLRAPFIDREIVADSLGLANVLKLNDHELTELASMFGLSTTEVRPAMTGLARLFGLSLVALTRGGAGSLLMADGVWSDHPGTAGVVVADTIGAGDAFTAALVVGLLAGRPLQAINSHANDVAGFVCSQPGATPLLPDLLRSPAPSACTSVNSPCRVSLEVRS